MRKRVAAALAVAAIATGAFAVSPARADSYCFSTGLTINGEPWLSHEQCMPCPVQDCPSPAPER